MADDQVLPIEERRGDQAAAEAVSPAQQQSVIDNRDNFVALNTIETLSLAAVGQGDALTQQTGAAVQPNEDEPATKIVVQPSGKTYTEKIWSKGAHAGEKERIFENRNRVRFKPDGKGGENIEGIDPDGKITFVSHFSPDGKGGVIEKHTDYSNSQNNYTAYHNTHKSIMEVDWENGLHLRRYQDLIRVGNESESSLVEYVSNTGPKASDNFTAKDILNGPLQINYADGSSYLRDKDNKETITDKYGNSHVIKHFEELDSLNDSFKKSASFSFHLSQSQLNLGFHMSQAEALDDVRKDVGAQGEGPLSLGDNQRVDKIVDILKKVSEKKDSAALSQQDENEIAKAFKGADDLRGVLECVQRHFQEQETANGSKIILWRSLNFDYRTPTGDNSGSSHIYHLASLDDNLIPKDNLSAATSIQAKAIADNFASMNRDTDLLIRKGQNPGLSLYNTGQELKRTFQSVSDPYKLAEMINLEMQTQAKKAGLVEPAGYKIDYGNSIQIWLTKGTSFRIENIYFGK